MKPNPTCFICNGEGVYGGIDNRTCDCTKENFANLQTPINEPIPPNAADVQVATLTKELEAERLHSRVAYSEVGMRTKERDEAEKRVGELEARLDDELRNAAEMKPHWEAVEQQRDLALAEVARLRADCTAADKAMDALYKDHPELREEIIALYGRGSHDRSAMTTGGLKK